MGVCGSKKSTADDAHDPVRPASAKQGVKAPAAAAAAPAVDPAEAARLAERDRLVAQRKAQEVERLKQEGGFISYADDAAPTKAGEKPAVEVQVASITTAGAAASASPQAVKPKAPPVAVLKTHATRRSSDVDGAIQDFSDAGSDVGSSDLPLPLSTTQVRPEKPQPQATQPPPPTQSRTDGAPTDDAPPRVDSDEDSDEAVGEMEPIAPPPVDAETNNEAKVSEPEEKQEEDVKMDEMEDVPATATAEATTTSQQETHSPMALAQDTTNAFVDMTPERLLHVAEGRDDDLRGPSTARVEDVGTYRPSGVDGYKQGLDSEREDEREAATDAGAAGEGQRPGHRVAPPPPPPPPPPLEDERDQSEDDEMPALPVSGPVNTLSDILKKELEVRAGEAPANAEVSGNANNAEVNLTQTSEDNVDAKAGEDSISLTSTSSPVDDGGEDFDDVPSAAAVVTGSDASPEAVDAAAERYKVPREVAAAEEAAVSRGNSVKVDDQVSIQDDDDHPVPATVERLASWEREQGGRGGHDSEIDEEEAFVPMAKAMASAAVPPPEAGPEETAETQLTGGAARGETRNAVDELIRANATAAPGDSPAATATISGGMAPPMPSPAADSSAAPAGAAYDTALDQLLGGGPGSGRALVTELSAVAQEEGAEKPVQETPPPRRAPPAPIMSPPPPEDSKDEEM